MSHFQFKMITKRIISFITLAVLSVTLTNAGEHENQPSPQLPVSILDEILNNHNNNHNNHNHNNNHNHKDNNNHNNNVSPGTDTNDNFDISSILGMIPSATDNSNTGDDSNNNTGIGILDFFRNLIAMFLRTFVQVFKLLQLLARSITGIGTKKLAFLSTDERNSDVSGNESTGFC